MKKIHIAHLLGGGILCGASQYVMKIIKGLEGDEFTFSIICIKDGPLAAQARDLGIPLNLINKSRTGDPSTIFKIAKVLRNEHVDLLHTQTTNSNLYGILGSFFYPPCHPVVTLHAYFREINEKAVRPFVRPLLGPGYRLEQILLKRAAHIITVSQSIKDRVVADGLKTHHLTVIPNGVDVDVYSRQADKASVRNEFGLKSTDILIGTAGRLSEEKNQGLILKAAAELVKKEKHLKIIFFGAGPEEKKLRHLTAELGLNSRVIFTGWREDVARCLSALDIFILSSRSEVAPFVILESMALGIPVIATNVGGVSEMVIPDKNGLLTNNNDVEQMAGVMARLIADPDYRKKLGSRGKDLVAERFSEQSMLAATRKVYLEVYHG